MSPSLLFDSGRLLVPQSGSRDSRWVGRRTIESVSGKDPPCERPFHWRRSDMRETCWVDKGMLLI